MAFKRIGLTGGIASGKSSVGALLKKAGFCVVNLDEVGRSVTDTDPEIHHQLAQIAPEAVTADGTVSRTLLRKVFFDRPDLRKQIEGVLHPAIWKAYALEEEKARASGHDRIICEAALLVDRGMSRKFDELVVVSAPDEMRKARLVERDHIPQELAEQMIRAQVSEERRRAEATTIIENTGSHEALKASVKKLVDRWNKENAD